MLNEGYTLYKSLERCGISLMPHHPDLKKPGRKEGLIVGLDTRGQVANIEYRGSDKMAELWTTSEGNHNSFPVLKLQHPLWRVDPNDAVRERIKELKKDEIKKRQFLMQQYYDINITSTDINWWARVHGRVDEMSHFFHTTEREYVALYNLMGRFLEANDLKMFLQELLNQLKKHDEIPYSFIENILIGNKWDKKKHEFRSEVPLVMDLCDWGNYPTRIASQKLESFVSECLFKMQKPSQTNGISALSGRIIEIEDKKFPNPTLPIIGQTYLFSVNDQTPCQTRYKKTSTSIFPAGRNEANVIQESLRWITSEERRGKTWYPVPGIKDSETDLLIVYLIDKPNTNLNKARLLGGVSSTDLNESTFEEIAAPIIDAYRGQHILKASDKIRFFVLRQADPGRKQVVVNGDFTASDVVKAAEVWQQAGGNVPPFALLFPGAKDENAKILTPRCPFPADLVRLTQKQWVRLGEDYSNKVPGIALGKVYDIFFDQGGKNKAAVYALLRIVLRRTEPLLIGLVGAMHKNTLEKFTPESRFTLLLAISVISICLYKLGISKEKYMSDTFFFVGRFLSLTDTLHMEYCKNIRNGNIPPQLLGNAHLNLALKNPAAAFALLSQRIGVYQAWTRKEQGEKVKLARWAVGEMGEIALSLANEGLPTTTDDAAKAQILLGYLAKSGKKESIGTDTDSVK
jgi:hypothetical protein